MDERKTSLARTQGGRIAVRYAADRGHSQAKACSHPFAGVLADACTRPMRAMTMGRWINPLLPCAVATTLAVALIARSQAPASADAPTASNFAFAIGNGTLKGDNAALQDRYHGFDLVIVDGEEATAAQIDAIQGTGATVLAYLSVGTIESWRSWYRKLKRFRLSAWRDWRDEWFADTSKGKYRRRVVSVARERILAKGFDGLFLDNVDMVEVRRHRKQRAGMARLVAALRELVDAEGGYLFAQNGAAGVLTGYPNQGVGPLGAFLDGWNREDVTFTWDFDRHRYKRVPAPDHETAIEELEAVAGLGLLTTATDYVDLADGSAAQECAAVANATSAGALPYVSNIGLTVTAVEANPPTCP
jgi:uncharacterized protein (TIGR01370 family)